MSGPFRVLALETSGPVCRVAHRAWRAAPATPGRALASGEVVSLERSSRFARHSEAVIALVDRVLRRARSKLDRLDAVAVSIGPGSFTGLRIGLAVAKVFAKFGGRPLVGVPTLEAMAAQASLVSGPGDYVAHLDAARGERYAAVYRCAREPGAVRLVSGPAVVAAPPAGPGATVVEPAAAGTIAALAAWRAGRGRFDDPDRLVPMYVRRPEAAVRRAASRARLRRR